ncbi:hypothetical protein FACS1894113_2010 [Alphaproteobacteria bacterium]|nr:hypothetical protein FACS1894113_2010 [Alphaproteobacteria bacterium]
MFHANCFADSLFMNEHESKAVFDMLNGKKEPEKDKKQIVISGIFYVNESEWTVWINNQPYSSLGEKDGFVIEKVTESGVYIELEQGNVAFFSVLGSR